MSSIKQWTAKKTNALKGNVLKFPFDGTIYTNTAGQPVFKFVSPGMVNGMFPTNMWTGSSLVEFSVPTSGSRWYIVAQCNFNKSISSVTLAIQQEEPATITPAKNSIPNYAEVPIFVGIGTSFWKLCKGNILVKPVLLFRGYKTEFECGTNPFEDYYSMLSVS